MEFNINYGAPSLFGSLLTKADNTRKENSKYKIEMPKKKSIFNRNYNNDVINYLINKDEFT